MLGFTVDKLMSDTLDFIELAGMWKEISSQKEERPAPDMLDIAGIDSFGLLQEVETPNPVRVDTLGPDSEQPKPEWVSENLLKEVEGLKKRLFQMENKLAKMGQKEGWTEKPVDLDSDKGLVKEIAFMKKRLDRLSDSLGLKDEPLPFGVKK